MYCSRIQSFNPPSLWKGISPPVHIGVFLLINVALPSGRMCLSSAQHLSVCPSLSWACKVREWGLPEAAKSLSKNNPRRDCDRDS